MQIRPRLGERMLWKLFIRSALFSFPPHPSIPFKKNLESSRVSLHQRIHHYPNPTSLKLTMVSLHSLLVTVTAIATLPLSLAKVYNVTAPPSAASGTNITAVLFTEGYIQNWDDFGVRLPSLNPFLSLVFSCRTSRLMGTLQVIWGLQLASHTCDACIGTMLSYNNL